jgi:hypothetical protein
LVKVLGIEIFVGQHGGIVWHADWDLRRKRDSSLTSDPISASQ